MIPFRDENPTVNLPIATYVIIGMNVVVWFTVQGFGSTYALAESFCYYALIPGDLLGSVAANTQIAVADNLACSIHGRGELSTLVSSMFMHGGWLHILGNMLFLWVFGDNVEDIMGPFRFACFYVLCGLAAAVAQILNDPTSVIPMVGASGAIGGVMGAYAIMFPRARVHMLIILVVYITTISVPAILMLGYWFLLQLLSGVGSSGGSGGGVAFWAHIGGFVAGVVLVFAFRDPQMIAARKRIAPRRSARHSWF
ncbi:MAG: rhomboid family intramembrane serine protease [Pseudomonadales bacterium]|nr:rhomboid family intramembrane serine protease [Pseudomonadales bacterium]